MGFVVVVIAVIIGIATLGYLLVAVIRPEWF